MLYILVMNSPIVHTMIESTELSLHEDGGLHQLNDIRDLYSDADTPFVATVISGAMRRGVKHLNLDGTSLGRLSDIVDALTEDGEVMMYMDDSEDDPKH